MAQQKSKRYQNISTMATSVMRENRRGEPMPVMLAPRAIVQLTDDDVELTKDRSQSRERNPFDMGLVAEIPAGKDQHPDAPSVPPRFDGGRIQQIMLEGTIDELRELLERAQDVGHVVVFDRALAATRKNMPEARLNDIEQAITDRRTEIASDTRRRGERLDAVIRG
jgi:hypothetical protein